MSVDLLFSTVFIFVGIASCTLLMISTNQIKECCFVEDVKCDVVSVEGIAAFAGGMVLTALMLFFVDLPYTALATIGVTLAACPTLHNHTRTAQRRLSQLRY